MSKLPILVSMDLLFLRDFLNHVKSDVATEWTEIEAQSERGEFEEYEDYERAMNYPLVRAEIGARAVYHELNALVESQLQALAETRWQRLNPSRSNDPAKWKTVADASFGQVRELIEAEYGIYLVDVEGWCHIEKLREVVNAYKHRRGNKRMSEIFKDRTAYKGTFRYETSIDEATQLLEQVPIFLDNLITAALHQTN
ncbi:hypothetical protein [Nevskia soli]|uniref:hypothetical protein n=1 Tax=Nevskia soli TaxID=418856 RepID=UPI0004A78285|nr:hypothetical protein [Nevskia soli]